MQAQKQEILAAVALEEADAKDSLKISHLFKDPSETRVSTRTWLAWTVSLGAPLFGVNVIIFYSASIFSALSLGVDITHILTTSLQSAAPMGMNAAFWVLPRFGRRLCSSGVALVNSL